MHPILSIAKFELSKKKVAARPMAIIGLSLVLLLFVGAFYLLSHYSYRPQHDYYTFNPTNTAIDDYINYSGMMHLVSSAAPDAGSAQSIDGTASRSSMYIAQRRDGTYLIESSDRFSRLAVIAALVDEIKRQNHAMILAANVSPQSLVLLNVTTRHREEILTVSGASQGDQSSGDTSTQINGRRITIGNQARITGPSPSKYIEGQISQINQTSQLNVTKINVTTSPLPSNSSSRTIPNASSRSNQNVTGENSSASVNLPFRVIDAGTGDVDGNTDGAAQSNPSAASSIAMSGQNPDLGPISSLRATALTSAQSGTSLASIASNSSFAVDAGQGNLLRPDDINTLIGVKDLFILIELMLVFNFFSALCGNSFFEEKINYRSSMLFSMPLRKRFIVVGKLLPYFILSIIVVLILLAFQYPFLLTNPLLYFLVAILGLLYFSASFFNGLLARSNKEYSFLNVFTTSILSLYLLIPAFVANYSSLGFASLLTPILLLAQKQTVSVSLVLFLGTVYAALAAAIFVMGSVLWNYERLYKYDSPFQKLLYIIRTGTTRAWQYFVYGVCCVPFLWLIQIVMIALFLVVPVENKLFLLLFGAALSEELVRNLVIRAHAAYVRNSPVKVTDELSAWKQAFFVGAGFGIAEKVILFVSIAPYLQGYRFIVMTGVLVPIAVHTLLTYLFSRALQKYDVAMAHPNMVCAFLALLHASFNFIIITYLGVQII